MDLSSSGNIKNHYRVIGTTLLELEPYTSIYNYILKRSPEALQSNLAFIPDEIIESYLEDLLDFTISDHQLHIYRRNFTPKYNVIAIFGLILSMAFGLKLAYSGASFYLALTGVLLIALPSGIIWHLAPKIAPNRRLFFVKLLSQELDRRNGGDQNRNLIKSINKLVDPSPSEHLPEMSRIKFH